MQERNTFRTVVVIVVILAVLGGAYYYFTRNAPATDTTNGTATTTPTGTDTTATTTDNGGNNGTAVGMPEVVTPKADDVVASPMTVSGNAPGPWFFEASFPIRLEDANGKELVIAPAQAQSDWMTTGRVPFSVTLKFTVPKTATSGTLVLMKDNPSGLPENAGEFRIPVFFTAAAKASASAKVNVKATVPGLQ